MKKYYYDIHIHSALSPCSDDDMTPNNIVNMAKLNGLDIIAVSDHNCMKNCRACMQVGSKNNILVVPAMELETSENIHVLCLFSSLECAGEFEKTVMDSLPDISNRPDIFGNQLIMDELDNVTASVNKLLIQATTISIDDISKICKRYCGIAVPAHINRQSHGIIGMLGTIPDNLGFNCIEVANCSDFVSCKENFKKYNIISNSDAHHLWNISEAENFIELKKFTIEDFIDTIDKKMDINL